MSRAPALIIGSAGQDGRLLAEQLANRGRALITCGRECIQGAGLSFGQPHLNDPEWVIDLIAQNRPAEVYYLAALNYSSEESAGNDRGLLAAMLAVNTQNLVNVLEAIRSHSPASRVFYAASAHVFGKPDTSPQNEDTPIRPTAPYGISKAAGIFACRRYREAHGVFASAGILYNHESSLRPSQFLSAKIARSVAEIRVGSRRELILGDLDAIADWGYAPDYTRAMQLIIGASAPDDFVIATGIPHTVREFAEVAFSAVGLNYNDYVSVDPTLLRRDNGALVGDSTRLRRVTGWRPSITFEAMVRNLVEHQLVTVSTANIK